MPDAGNAHPPTAAADHLRTPTPDINPDRVGEELADDARIWRVYDRVAKEDDDRRIAHWNRGLDNLALFAGLFSAVTTAFIIEAQNDMKPDYAELTFQVLNATSFKQHFAPAPFAVPSSARTVNCLWVSSLILSLSAALIAIMGKDWIGMYAARPVCNLRQWAEMRTYRLLCVERWYMSGVIAAAPVLLHVSLLLFGAGLVFFVSSDPLTHHLTLGLSLASGALYLVTALSAVIFSDSPYKSPATQLLRCSVSAFLSYVRTLVHRPKRNLVSTILQDVNMMIVGRAYHSSVIPGGTPRGLCQIASTTLSKIRSYLQNVIYLPKRDLARTLGRDLNPMHVGCTDDPASLPGPAPQSHERRARRSLAAIFFSATNPAIVYARSIPTFLRTGYSLGRSHMRSLLRTIAFPVNRVHVSDWFLSSTWTDLTTDRRPELLAKAVSWLSDASQAPDVFRAIVFALGDLDVGLKVGEHTSLALRTRLRAEIRRTWQQVDPLTLSRYVLSDRNTPGDPVLNERQFSRRFYASKRSEPRCEDGLAALIIVCGGFMNTTILASYSTDKMSQPRMPAFLLSYIRKPQKFLTEGLILLSWQYRKHLGKTNSFNVKNLELSLYDSLDTATRRAYASELAVKYGGTAGAIEILTFLCCNNGISPLAIPAAVDLVMELLLHVPVSERRCLAYLFGSTNLWGGYWPKNRWLSWSLTCLRGSLYISLRHPFPPSSVRTHLDDLQFDVSLARTAVMVLTPPHDEFCWERGWIKFLFGHLCQSPPSPGVVDDRPTPDIISLILESPALLTIAGVPRYYVHDDNLVIWGTAILAAIISDLGRRICNPATVRSGEQLFAALTRREVKGADGDELTWDLSKWLRTQAAEIVKRYPSGAYVMQCVHDALTAIYPLCEHNEVLSAHWDWIGYPGRPGDIFSDPFLELGCFFESAEKPWPTWAL